MDEFRRNFGVTDIQHPFEDNFLIKLRRWCLLYLTRSILGLCIHVADFPSSTSNFDRFPKFPNHQTSRSHFFIFAETKFFRSVISSWPSASPLECLEVRSVVVGVWHISPRPPRSQNGEETLFKIGKEYKGDVGCIQIVLSQLGRTCAVVPFASISYFSLEY
jgi:hypothetical protein